MECREAREFFSPYLDEELTREERAALEGHLDSCPACREELSRWQELARALRGLKVAVAAPPGFTAAVLARIAGGDLVAVAGGEEKAAGRGGRPGERPWQGARRLVAAAAAVAVLAAGSIGYAARGAWQQLPGSLVAAIHQGHSGGEGQVAEAPGDKVTLPAGEASGNAAGPGTPPGAGQAASPSNQPGSGSTVTSGNPGGAAGPQPGEANAATGGRQTGQPAGESGKGSQAAGNAAQQPGSNGSDQQPTRVAGNEPYPARSFLSTGRQVTSTMLKVSVADIAAARAKALGLAGSSGAGVQVIADQDNGGERRFICQLAVPAGRATSLLASLQGLGRVTSSNTSTQDLTQQFSATLEQYQAKVAQVNATTDPAEKEKLLQEAKALEQQLSTWEQETKQQTIILWLETK